MYYRGIFVLFSLHCNQITVYAYKISLKENKNQPLGQNHMNGLCLLINIRC